MPWKTKGPTPEQLQRRIAYLIALRSREQGQSNIAKRAGVSRNTVAKYGDPDYCETKKGAGPQRLDVTFKILLATGDDPAKVIHAAMHSHDETTFRAMLHCVLIAQQNVAITTMNNDRLNRPEFSTQPVPMSKRKLTDMPTGGTPH